MTISVVLAVPAIPAVPVEAMEADVPVVAVLRADGEFWDSLRSVI